MTKGYIYIGSNNETHALESERAIEIISEHFDGFSAYEIIGFWKGSQEKTLKVEIINDGSTGKLVQLCKELKTKLHQESILLEIVESNIAFIQ